jgi:hypothetical protein
LSLPIIPTVLKVVCIMQYKLKDKAFDYTKNWRLGYGFYQNLNTSRLVGITAKSPISLIRQTLKTI